MTKLLDPSLSGEWPLFQKVSEIMSLNHQNNNRPSDEMLVAFADGTLGASESADVARYLESDADAREFVQRLQASGRLAVEAFDDVLNAPPPRRLVETIMGAAPAHQDNVVPMRPAVRRGWPTIASGSFAIAASLTLVAAVSVWMLDRKQATDTPMIVAGPVAPGAPLERLLETRPSGETAELQPGQGQAIAVAVVNSFYDGAGRICREVEVTRSGAMAHAIGCRVPSAGWTIEGVVEVATGASDGQSFKPAGGQSVATIDEVLARIAARPPLTVEEEASLLDSRWSAARKP